MYMVKNIIRALRLPFIAASALPFIFGSLIKRQNFNILTFLLGLIAVIATHLSANLINDYADSKSRADWQDKNFYKFFGGSKLIQENIFSEKFYLKAAIFFAVISGLAVIMLCAILNNLKIFGLYLAILFLGWSYSEKPLRFSYHRCGEIIIFILFGPALVMGGYFIQTKIFPDFESLLLSFPFGFLITAVLFANEVPDFLDDTKVGKFTWVSLTGQKAFILYSLLMFLAFFTIGLGVIFKYLNPIAVFSFVFILLAIRAAKILKGCFGDKIKLIESSRLTITVQTFVSIILILQTLL